MRKMPCLFERDFADKRRPVLLNTVTPGCEWVLAGEGVASIKRDGTACAVIGGALHARYDAKRGKQPPAGAIPCSEPDDVTGHWPHWVRVGDEPHFKWHREAWEASWHELSDGTYELCGPRLQGNPERLDSHRFIRHGAEVVLVERSRVSLALWLAENQHEGLVFAHPDGRFAKIRRADFGMTWPPAAQPVDTISEGA